MRRFTSYNTEQVDMSCLSDRATHLPIIARRSDNTIGLHGITLRPRSVRAFFFPREGHLRLEHFDARNNSNNETYIN